MKARLSSFVPAGKTGFRAWIPHQITIKSAHLVPICTGDRLIKKFKGRLSSQTCKSHFCIRVKCSMHGRLRDTYEVGDKSFGSFSMTSSMASGLEVPFSAALPWVPRAFSSRNRHHDSTDTLISPDWVSKRLPWNCHKHYIVLLKPFQCLLTNNGNRAAQSWKQFPQFATASTHTDCPIFVYFAREKRKIIRHSRTSQNIRQDTDLSYGQIQLSLVV